MKDQQGDKNPNWKGNDASRSAMLKRVNQERGQPSECEVCGTRSPSRKYFWSPPLDITNFELYTRMCSSCIRKKE